MALHIQATCPCCDDLKHMIGPFEMITAPPQHAERLLRHGLALASAQAPMVCEPNSSGME